MKHIIYSILAIAMGLMSCNQEKKMAEQPKTSQCPQTVNIMTFNIRYDNPDDNQNNWKFRRDRVCNAILFYGADIVGAQEVLNNQLNDIKERLTNYNSIGVGREDGKMQGEYSAIFYRNDRFTEKKSGYFWLSQTPEQIGAKGWDAACERIATWAILSDKTSGKEIFILNTHLDHVGQEARDKSVHLIMNRVAEYAKDLPVVVTGDFNSNPESLAVKTITDTTDTQHLTDSRTIAKLVYGPQYSFHDFGKIPMEQREIIDYIFVKNGIIVLKYGILAETDGNNFLSDHNPIMVNIEF